MNKSVLLHCLLAVSLGTNGLLFLDRMRAASAAQSIPQRPLRAAPAPAVGSRVEPAAAGVGGTAQARAIVAWDQIESSDYRQYMANLRKIGCPEETIRDLVAAEINKLYAPKLAALSSQQTNYWKFRGGMTASERLAQRDGFKRLNAERDTLIRDLVGVDPRNDSFGDALSQKVSFLPEAKRQPVRDVVEAYDHAQAEIISRSGNLMTSDDHEQLAQLDRARHQALTEVMTRAEVEQYELRDSPTADRLRAQLSAFDPSENEYQALFRLQQAFDQQYTGNENNVTMDSDSLKHKLQAQKVLEAQIQAALGKDRYADYQRSQDTAYSSLVELSQRYDLPKETAARIYEMKQIAETQIAQVQAGGNPDSPQTQEIISATGRQTVATVRAMLGEKAFANYLQHSGFWLQRISP